jgi:hypothetical protein
MTPKEKAEELVDNFRLNVLDYEGCGINEHKAKQCALIAVDEILRNIYKNSSFEIYHINNDKMNEFEAIHYWQEVKQEIEKL